VETKTQWLVGGALLVLGVCALMPLGSDPTPLVPTPTYQFALWVFTGYGYLIFLPVAYAISVLILWDSRNFRWAVLGLTVFLALLTVAWFAGNWADGVSYPGRDFTRAVAFENAVGIAIAIVFSVMGVVRSSKHDSATAHLAIFLVLAWCGFPLLGRIDL